jgi:hypothetical protein
MNQRNIHTQAPDIPANIDGETPPSVPTLRAHGWRIEPPVPPVQDGYTRTSTRPDGAPGLFIEGDGETGAWEVVDRPNADIEAEKAAQAAAATAARAEAFKLFAQPAALFRATLRKHFGDGAETNKAVTAEAVAAHFEAKRMNATITALDTADAMALRMYFDMLSQWNGTGETWSLPWEVVP